MAFPLLPASVCIACKRAFLSFAVARRYTPNQDDRRDIASKYAAEGTRQLRQLQNQSTRPLPLPELQQQISLLRSHRQPLLLLLLRAAASPTSAPWHRKLAVARMPIPC